MNNTREPATLATSRRHRTVRQVNSDGLIPEEVPATLDARTVVHLERFHRARERSSRCNRNLLQYGAALMAVIGIALGTGSVLALARSLAEAQGDAALFPDWGLGVLIGIGSALAALALLLFLLLCQAFLSRLGAEHAADAALAELIRAEPERYLPAEG